jgi:RNA polymerase sigma-70 factor (ECF subfamily)
MARPEGSRTSTTLLGQLADPRNEAAWRRFLERYQPLIRGWCAAWHLPAQEQEEVTAAVLLKLAVEMRRFRYDPGRSFRAWLKTVVNNAVKDLLRDWRSKPGARGTGDSAALEALQQLQAPGPIDSLAEGPGTSLDRDRELAQQAEALVRQRVEPRTWEAFWIGTCRPASPRRANPWGRRSTCPRSWPPAGRTG